MNAIIEIHQALIKAGLSEDEANGLAARFLDEEAFDYVDSMRKLFGEDYRRETNDVKMN